MNNQHFINDFQFNHFTFQHLHTVGSEIVFHNPCIGYIKKGYAKFLYQGRTIYVREGDLIYIAMETEYQSIWFGSPDVEWYSITFSFVSKFSFFDYRFQILKNYPPTLFEKMYAAYEQAPMLAISYFYQLLDDIYKKLKKTPANSSYAVIEPALLHIENHFFESISVNTLSLLCHLSESGFFKAFKQATGVTPIAYKHNIMIQKSMDLLLNTNDSIEEISSKVGFSSPNYFRKVFVKLTDKTPKEIRKNNIK